MFNNSACNYRNQISTCLLVFINFVVPTLCCIDSTPCTQIQWLWVSNQTPATRNDQPSIERARFPCCLNTLTTASDPIHIWMRSCVSACVAWSRFPLLLPTDCGKHLSCLVAQMLQLPRIKAKAEMRCSYLSVNVYDLSISIAFGNSWDKCSALEHDVLIVKRPHMYIWIRLCRRYRANKRTLAHKYVFNKIFFIWNYETGTFQNDK